MGSVCILTILVVVQLNFGLLVGLSLYPPPEPIPPVAAYTSDYLITFPRTIRPGLKTNIFVNILKYRKWVRVNAYLKNSGRDVLAKVGRSFRKSQPSTMELNIPSDLLHGTYYIAVNGTIAGRVFQGEKMVTYNRQNMTTFIQTDKGVYKPGQTVRFRILAVHPSMLTFKGEFDVDIKDPKGNLIKQIRGERGAGDVYQGQLRIADDPVMGDWRIEATATGMSSFVTFSVEKYVLPKFEVSVNLPSFISMEDTEAKGSITAMYTYGKPVTGTASIRLKVDPWYSSVWNPTVQPVVEKQITLGQDNSFTITLAQMTTMAQYGSLAYKKLKVEANVTETLNGIVLSGAGETTVYSSRVKVDFLSTSPSSFKPGLKNYYFAKVSEQDGRPVGGKGQNIVVSVTITEEVPVVVEEIPVVSSENVTTTPNPFIQQIWYPQPMPSTPTKTTTLPDETLDIPDDGVIMIAVDAPELATSITIKATYGKIVSSRSLSKARSPSGSYLFVTMLTTNPHSGTNADFLLNSNREFKEYTYLILSRGAIVTKRLVTLTAATKIAKLQVRLLTAHAPSARLVVYYMEEEEIVPDGISFNVQGAFENKVSLKFSRSRAEPGDTASLLISAADRSFVYSLVVDQSVLLLDKGNDIAVEQVLTEIQKYNTFSSASVPYPMPGPMPMPVGRRKRSIWFPYPYYPGGSDATGIFDNAGLNVITDAHLYKYVPPFYGYPMMAMAMENSAMAAVPMVAGFQNVERIRSNFPETWLWSMEYVRCNEYVNITQQVPDTITSWIASAFATHRSKGLGIAEQTAKLTTFQPFFVSLNLPYSVTRGEEVILQINVFNYLKQDLLVKVTLEWNEGFKVIGLDDSGNEIEKEGDVVEYITVASDDAGTVYVPIKPTSLGLIDLTVKAQSAMAGDGVMRQILVEAEGIPQEYNQAVLIDLRGDNNHFTTDFSVAFPDGTVEGSERIVVSVIGDVMGTTMSGLANLLRMPYGCGEQNLLNFAPNTYITSYLQATSQLTAELKDKTLEFMLQGYQKQLKYQRFDGSYSAFGDRDPSGSTWLTAFVGRCFHEAKTYISVDDNLLEKAIAFLASNQNPDGTFKEPGRVIHSDMQGGSSKGNALVAYVLISLLENKDVNGAAAAISDAQAYLEGATVIDSLTDPYDVAIITYALTLAGSSHAADLLAKLELMAKSENGHVYWMRDVTAAPPPSHRWIPPHKQANAINVEMTSYALLVYAQHSDLEKGIPVMKWLIAQQNEHGGFVSTQDTVVALQALSEFAKFIYSSERNIGIKVTGDGGIKHSFRIRASNAIVLQMWEVPEIVDALTITATGQGTALAQVSVSYNVLQMDNDPAFALTATLTTDTLSTITVHICTSWLRSGASGMALLEIGIPSGFDAEKEQFDGVKIVKRVDTANKKIILYFDSIGSDSVCVDVEASRSGMVAKSMSVPVKVYDYYDPDAQETVFYKSAVLESATFCDVCGDHCPGCNVVLAVP